MASASDLSSMLSKGISDAVPSASADQISGLLNTDNLSSTISNLSGEASSLLNSAMSSASSVVGSSLSDLTSSVSNVASGLFGNVSDQASKLTSMANDLSKGTQEVDDKIQSLASDSASALAQPISFITNTKLGTISGASTTASGAGIKDLLSGMSSTDLSNIGKSLGTDITSSSDLGSAIKDISNSLSEHVSAIPSTLNSLRSSIVEPITSGLGTFSGSLMDGIRSTVSSINSATGIGAVLSAGDNIFNSALDALPTPVASFVTSKLGASSLTQAANNLLSSKAASLSKITNALGGIVSGNSDLLSSLIAISNQGGTYPSVSDDGGGDLTALYGDTTEAKRKALYKAANSICKVSEGANKSYSSNKDLFDMLLRLSSQLGITDLVRQLKQCAGGEAAYFDDRSTRVLTSLLSTTASSGNVSTYQTIQDTAGAQNISNNVTKLVQLGANMKQTDDNIKMYNNTVKAAGFTVGSLVTAKTTVSPNVIDGQLGTVMTASGKKLMNNAIGTENTDLMLGAMATYAN